MNENLPGQDKAQVPVLSTPLRNLLLPQQRRIRKCCGNVSKSSCQDTCCYSQQKNQTVFNEDEKYSHLCKSCNYTVCLCTFTFSGKKKKHHFCTPPYPYSACYRHQCHPERQWEPATSASLQQKGIQVPTSAVLSL